MMLRDLMPDGWSCTVRRDWSLETLSWSMTIRLRSTPDIIGRVAVGVVSVRGLTPRELLDAVHREVCRMDAELVHELSLVDDVPDTGLVPRQDRCIVPGGGHAPRSTPPHPKRTALSTPLICECGCRLKVMDDDGSLGCWMCDSE